MKCEIHNPEMVLVMVWRGACVNYYGEDILRYEKHVLKMKIYDMGPYVKNTQYIPWIMHRLIFCGLSPSKSCNYRLTSLNPMKTEAELSLIWHFGSLYEGPPASRYNII